MLFFLLLNITEPKKGKITLKTNLAKENIVLEFRSKDIDEPEIILLKK